MDSNDVILMLLVGHCASKWSELLVNTSRLRIVQYFVPVIVVYVLWVCASNDVKCMTVPMKYVVYFCTCELCALVTVKYGYDIME